MDEVLSPATKSSVKPSFNRTMVSLDRRRWLWIFECVHCVVNTYEDHITDVLRRKEEDEDDDDDDEKQLDGVGREQTRTNSCSCEAERQWPRHQQLAIASQINRPAILLIAHWFS